MQPHVAPSFFPKKLFNKKVEDSKMPIRWQDRTGSDGKIQMIKAVRMKGDVGLKEAKDAIELVGETLDDSTSNEEIVLRALFQIDPQRFPLPVEDEGIDYERLWHVFRAEIQGDSEEFEDRMDQLYGVFEREAKKRSIQKFVDRLVFGALEQRISTVEGLDTICIYDHNNDFTPLDISKPEFTRMLGEAFGRWIQTI
jgi:hypothetical protein